MRASFVPRASKRTYRNVAYRVLLTLLAVLAVLAVRIAPARANTLVGGNITANTTWTTANSPYEVTSTIVVYNGARLTIQPGVTVLFHSGTSMIIAYYDYAHGSENGVEQGALTVSGTASSPVVFTSSSGAAGGWAGLAFGQSSQYGGTTSSLSYLTVTNAGQGNTLGGTVGSQSADIMMFSTGTNFTFNNVSTTSSTGIGLIAYSSALTATNVTSMGNTSYGVWAYASTLNLSGSNISNNGSFGAYYQSSSGSINGNTFASNASYGLYTAGSAPSITSNTFTSNGNYAIYYNISDAPTITGNTMSGDTHPGIQVNGGLLTANHAWSLQTGETDFTVTGSDIVVYNGARLTVGGGSTVYFAASTGLIIAYYDYAHGSQNAVEQGALTVNGTSALPVLFTSQNGNAGGWQGVSFGQSSQYGGLTSTLSYLTIANAGQAQTMAGTIASTSAGLIMFGTGTSFSFTSVAVNTSSGAGFYVSSSQFGNSSVVATNCSASGNATYDMYLVGSTAYTSGMTLTSGGVDGAWFDSSSATMLNPTVTGNTEGVHVRNNSSPTLSGGTISNNTNYGVYTEDLASRVTVTGATVNGNGHVMQVSVNSTVNTNSFSGNANQGVYMVGGLMTANGRWYLPGTGTFQPYIVLNETVVYNGARLTVDAGVTVEFASATSLIIAYYDYAHGSQNGVEQGALTVNGTSASPTIFTSQSGATNGWKGVAFGQSSQYGGTTSTLTYLTVANAGQGQTMGTTVGSESADVMMFSTGTGFTWDHVQTNTATGIGLIVYSSALSATNGTATGNTSYGVWAYASTLNMSGATVSQNGSFGAYYQSSNGSINGNTFASNASYGLYTAGSAPSITSNTFTSNGNYAIYYNISDAPTITGNTMSGDTHPGIQVNGGLLTANHAWSLQTGETDFTVTGSDIVVYNGARLTVGGGSTVYFAASTGLIIAYYDYAHGSQNAVEQGALTVNGTSALPVLFTSQNGNAGGWQGVSFGQSSQYGGLTSTLSYLTIANAGQAQTMGGTIGSTSAGLIMFGTGTSFSFTSVAVNTSSGAGYYLSSSQFGNSGVVATNCSASGNATYDMYLVGSTAYTSGMTLTSGGVDGAWFDASSATMLNPTVTGNTEGVHVRNNSSPTLSGGTISNNTNYGVYTEDLASRVTVTGATVNGNGHVMQVSVNSTVNTNSFSGNANQGVYMVGGLMTANGRWYLPGTGTFQPYIVLNETVVYNGARLTVDAGVTVEFASATSLIIAYYDYAHGSQNGVEQGALTVNGTSSSPTIFTSQSGATNGWKGVAFGQSSQYGGTTSTLTYLTVANAGQGQTMGGTVGSESADVMMFSTGTGFTWDHVQTNTATGIGLIAYSSALSATNGTATGNTSYGVWAYASTLNMSGATVSQNGSFGAYYQSSNGSINGNTFASNASYGLYTAGSAPSITSNTFTSNGNYAIYYNISDAPTITGNTMSGDTHPGIQVNGGLLTASHTWATQTGEPFFTVTGSDIVVYNGAVLTAAAGNTIKFSSSTGLIIAYYNYAHGSQNGVEQGSLQVQGSDQSPVLFTAANGNAGGWQGIFFGQSASYGGTLSTLDYLIIEKGGQAQTMGGTIGSTSANLAFFSDSQVVNNATIAQGSGAGIYSSGSSSTVRNTVVAYNATYGLYNTGGAPSFTYGDTFQNTSGNSGWGPSTGSIASSPEFVNYAGGDYHLSAGSPCVGTGVAVAGLAHLGTSPDMGAVQFGAVVNCANPATVNGTACAGANPCFQTYTCENGACAGTNPVVCGASDQCHVAGVCNTTTGACSNPTANDGTSCNDGNPCTQTDSCQAGVCTGSNPIVCAALDQCHAAGTCSPSTGVCSNPAASNGTSCTGNNPCFQTNTCENGTCTGSNPVTCAASDQCHVAGVCNPSTGQCTNPPVSNGTACSGASACMQTNVCENGTCTGSNPIVCAQLDQCHGIGTCNASTGQCTNPALADGTSCNDGNACTQTDTCQTGTCTGSNPVTCAASDQCHAAGVCNPASGTCSNPAAANGTACNDGNACTQTDTCQSGACTGGNPVVCAAGDQCHTAGVCNPASGTCSSAALADGTACNDGDACTQADTCQSGACTGGNPVICAASDQCHTAGVCNPASGACSNPAVNNGTACNDGNACTQTDTCQSGACTGSNPVVCAASDQCHVAGACNPASGTCSNPAVNNGTACNDGNACTQTDTCQSGTCTGSNPVLCAASDQCHTAGACNSASGACSNPAVADGTACNDGNACTSSDQCTAGVCGGTAYTCSATSCDGSSTCDGNGGCTVVATVAGSPCPDDGNPCTSDTCDRSGDCTHPAVASGTSCGAGLVCNGTVCSSGCFIGGTLYVAGAVNPTNACQVCAPGTSTTAWSSQANGTACNDGNACTQTDTCQAGTCTGGNLVVCGATDQCHVVGVCDPASGLCSNPAAANGTACNDNNACTQTDTCQAGACTGSSPVVCAASDQCHAAGVCNPDRGTCSNPALANGTACNDGNACTQTDTCQAGACTGSSPVVCAASDQCHAAGACDPSTGQCSSPTLSDGTSCDDGDSCTQLDACLGGVCTGADPVVCVAINGCHAAGTCDPSTGACTNPVLADGTACTGTSACVQTNTCAGGECTGSNPVVCTALDQCHAAGTCDPGTGACSNPPLADGTACNDGDACTQTDTCDSGTCVGSSPVVCAAASQCQDPGVCDPASGQCAYANAPNGALCDDGDACTQTDACQNGACAGSNPVVCAALDQCHVAGVCSPSTGVCSDPQAANGTACNDGDACTHSDTCQGGTCFGASPVVCAALDQCHVAGVCSPATGLCNTPPAPDGTACNDGDLCTQADACVLGVCKGASQVNCAALDACHLAGVCSPSTGQCTNPAAPNGAPPGGSTSCNTGLLGVCAAGATTCAGGALVCHQNVQPSAEICDGLDNNCDGQVDEGNPGGGAACGTGLLGVCAAGTTTCTGGALACHQNVQPSAEICDGLDNNCNGQVDEGNPGGGAVCNTGLLGVCSAGTTSCANAAIVCHQNVQPSAEICDGLDNNCNGLVDEGNPGGGAACNTGRLGVCAAGTTTCAGGAVGCAENVQPSAETCDGLDNNCNGQVDEGDPGGGQPCNTGLLGVCAAGVTACAGGTLACDQTTQPSPEKCDGLDNNCNGQVDEGCAPVCLTIERGVSGKVADTQVATDPTNPTAATTNFGSSTVFNTGMVGKGIRETLLEFDLSMVPPAAIISSASVTLTVKLDNELQTVRAHRITAPWSEATVTWSTFNQAFDPLVEGTFSNNGPAFTGPVSMDLTNLVQEWVAGNFVNDGLLLEQTSSGATGTNYWSSEYLEPQRPRLKLCYTTAQ